MGQDNTDQIAFWGGDAGHTWVTQQQAMDALLTPVLDGVMARAHLRAGQSVLDIGCGTGQSTVAAAEAVGADGYVLGADVSAPMLALAEPRAAAHPQATFVCADVSEHVFERPFDHLISRFGVMFFDDTQAAFTHMTQALVPGGQMTFATWGAIEANPWFTLPARVGRGMFGPTPKSDPDGPGPFALRDAPKVSAILRGAGLEQVTVEVEDIHLSLDGGAPAIAALCMHIGPAANTVAHFDLDAQDQSRLRAGLTQAFADLPNAQVPAQINFFTAVRP